MIAAKAQLGIGYPFLHVQPARRGADCQFMAGGLGKGIVFGILIGLIACHFGLRIEPNTVSLARAPPIRWSPPSPW